VFKRMEMSVGNLKRMEEVRVAVSSTHHDQKNDRLGLDNQQTTASSKRRNV